MDISFKGKRALVTGAGRGIGRSIALKLAELGADVIAVSRTQETLDSLKAECGARGAAAGSIQTVRCDLSDWAATERALSRCVAGGDQPVRLLVNNAGTNVEQPFGDVTEDAFDTIFNINVKSLLNVTQVVTAPLRSPPGPGDGPGDAGGSGGGVGGAGGSVVNLSSQASRRHLPSHLVYCASKAAVDQITRSLAAELGPHNIRVNAVNPTVTLTDLGKASWSEPVKAKGMLERIPLNRFAEVSEVVDAVMYLLSDRSSMITGALLPVEGGFWTK